MQVNATARAATLKVAATIDMAGVHSSGRLETQKKGRTDSRRAMTGRHCLGV